MHLKEGVGGALFISQAHHQPGTSPDPHPTSCHTTHDWRSSMNSRHSGSHFTFFTFFFSFSNHFIAFLKKKERKLHWLDNVIANPVQSKGFFNPALPCWILLPCRIIHCITSKTFFTSHLDMAQNMCKGSINKCK